MKVSLMISYLLFSFKFWCHHSSPAICYPFFPTGTRDAGSAASASRLWRMRFTGHRGWSQRKRHLIATSGSAPSSDHRRRPLLCTKQSTPFPLSAASFAGEWTLPGGLWGRTRLGLCHPLMRFEPDRLWFDREVAFLLSLVDACRGNRGALVFLWLKYFQRNNNATQLEWCN